MSKCRLCLCEDTVGPEPPKSDHMVFIFNRTNSLVLLIWNCCQLQVEENDGLPDSICWLCYSKLKLFDEFKSSCRRSDKTLRNTLVESTKVKVEQNFNDGNEDFCDDGNYSKSISIHNNCELEDRKPNSSELILYTESNKQDFIKKENQPYSDYCVQTPYQSAAESIFECNVCSDTFSTKSCLIQHSETHRRDFKCDHCGQVFTQKHLLTRHIIKQHTDPEIPDLIGWNRPYRCNVCSSSFVVNEDLISHAKIHDGQRRYLCEACPKAFLYKSSLNKHTATHTGTRPYICHICFKAFIYKSNLSDHQKIHTGIRPHKCHLCPKAFYCKSDLNKHMFYHSEKRLFNCNVCSKDFVLKSVFKTHMKIHSGDKSQKCDLCSKSFSQQSTFKLHLKTHSADNNLHKCDICPKTNKFIPKDNSQLDKQRTHKCRVCSESFPSTYYLNRHIKIHNHEAPYRCAICSESFPSKTCLISHMIVHVDNKPYKCAICPKAFVYKTRLDNHVKLHVDNILIKSVI